MVYCVKFIYYLILVNALKRIFKLLQFYTSSFPQGHTKECDLILTLYVNFALSDIVPYFIKSVLFKSKSVFWKSKNNLVLIDKIYLKNPKSLYCWVLPDYLLYHCSYSH